MRKRKTMKISLNSLELFIAYVITLVPQTLTKNHLSAVSSLVGSESFYVYIRKKRVGKLTPYASFPMEEPINVKENICADILKSVLFDSCDIDPVNPYLQQKYPTIYNDLKQKYPSVYENLYVKYPNESGFTNPYQILNVTISKRSVYKEYMFKCPARKRKSNEMVEYFVSRKYDVNENMRHTVPRIEGRFIFIKNQENEMKLFALAEEPARQSFDTNTIESVYMRYGKKRMRKTVDSVDPMCSLTKARKVRLCTIVLNAIGCQGSIRFLPYENNIEPECERKTMSFKFKKKTGSPKEWMVGCKAEIFGTGKPVTFYISRGYKPGTYYVYNEVEDQIVFHHMSLDVGIYLKESFNPLNVLS